MIEHVKFTKNTEWLKPFIAASGSLVPLDKLRRVRGFRVARGLEEQVEASCIRYRGRFSINLRMQNVPLSKGEKYTNVRYEPLLIALAHELAHMVEWEHTYKHFHLMSKIMKKFGRVIDKIGIEDTSFRWDNKFKKNKEIK